MRWYFLDILLVSLLVSAGCSTKTTINPYSEKNTKITQLQCEDSIRGWIKNYAAFPDSYVPLLFEKVSISISSNLGKEIVPLRKLAVEHTFEIRSKDYSISHATLVFELTPDYFVQNVRYNNERVVSLQKRLFPPDYKLWVEQYGRILTGSDTLSWDTKNRKAINDLFEVFFFNRYIQPEGENSALTDSLIKEMNRLYFSN